MVTSVRAKSIWALSLAGGLYGLIGIAFPNPSADARAWRLAAFAVSGVVYICHIAFEQFRLRTSPTRTAVHVAICSDWWVADRGRGNDPCRDVFRDCSTVAICCGARRFSGNHRRTGFGGRAGVGIRAVQIVLARYSALSADRLKRL